MVVYADLVFLINFLVDLLLLMAAGKLSGRRVRFPRATLGAGLGALYATACCFPGLSFLGNPLWRLVSLVGMTVLVFGVDLLALRQGVLFFLLSMALGGLAIGFSAGTVWTLVLAGAGLWLLCLLGFGGDPNTKYAEITVNYRGKQVQLTALLDTGNSLKDPISGCPVLVADDRAAAALLDLSPRDLENPLQTLEAGRGSGLRLIPYHTVGNPTGFLLAVMPDSVLADGKEVRLMVAFAPHSLGENKGFNALAGGRI